MDDDDDTLDAYPEGNYVVVSGSMISGYKFWGPFKTMRPAVEWVEEMELLIGHVTIVDVRPPEEF